MVLSSQSSDYNNLQIGGLMYRVFHMELYLVEPFMKPSNKQLIYWNTITMGTPYIIISEKDTVSIISRLF